MKSRREVLAAMSGIHLSRKSCSIMPTKKTKEAPLPTCGSNFRRARIENLVWSHMTPGYNAQKVPASGSPGRRARRRRQQRQAAALFWLH